MMPAHQCLTNTTVWNQYMAQLHDMQSKQMFIEEALQQYENEHHKDGLRIPQVIVGELHQGMGGHYVWAAHVIYMPFLPDLSCTQYLSRLIHEHEHVYQQQSGRIDGHQSDTAQMARISFAVYPPRTYARKGKFLRPDYTYNYNELRALLAEAKWIHEYYQERMNVQPPDCFLQEKQDIITTMRDAKIRIQSRQSISHALDINKANIRKLLSGKFNQQYVPDMKKGYMSRFMKTTGKRLIKETMRELKEMARILGEDIKVLDSLAPQHATEATHQERKAVEEHNQQQEYNALTGAMVKELEVVSETPTEPAYAMTEANGEFPEQVQNTTEYPGSLHMMEPQHGQYRLCVPIELEEEPTVDTRKVEQAPVQVNPEEKAFDISALGEIEDGTL